MKNYSKPISKTFEFEIEDVIAASQKEDGTTAGAGVDPNDTNGGTFGGNSYRSNLWD